MSVRYPEHDCFEDYEEDNITTEDPTKTKRDTMINELIEYECEHITVSDLIAFYKSTREDDLDSMTDSQLVDYYKGFF
jgi:hypothetical protein